ncbi:prefoldin subunit 3, putative [Plasmodium sp. gorilla clade G2]|uniref:prefoldin subunit 3, putative n=1 Tax=Plasmodium sp. gorilla clade G2 TaxID=880535 RepID=UPI000D2116EB|nr:prefoldin subunit 3, putative [Plasmodium sp. gorilla clade G2]SOV13099.1 prefoldin subunit 3, putative [Plasmodium sp. gorilla clade G2]
MSFDDLTDNTKSLRNIPGAKYIEHIAEFLQNKNEENILRQARELLLKYKFMEHSFVTRQVNTQKKIPELTDALRVVKTFQKKKQMGKNKNLVTLFPVEESLFAKGIIENFDNIMLWLGANVMVEFTFNEAINLLNQHLQRAINLFKELDEELSWLHQQICTTEINISRIHNYVEMKKGMKEKEADNKTEQVN